MHYIGLNWKNIHSLEDASTALQYQLQCMRRDSLLEAFTKADLDHAPTAMALKVALERIDKNMMELI